jgi:hypothetical protein
VNNCGACNRVCTVQHATPICNAPGVCSYSSCDAGYEDILAGVPGCEYLCPNPARPAESCNGIDEDCDGVVDNGNPGGGANCGTDVGECEFGTSTCIAGILVCVGGRPAATVDPCDNKDNDCDGMTDEGFDKQNDPNHCGALCQVCNLPNAIEGCSAGACTVSSCLPGFVNLNGTSSDGCEYACSPTGVEVCDGRDNDCDGLTDTMDTSLQPVSTNFCRQQGACAGTAPVCTGSTVSGCDASVRWRCVYAGQTEHNACGDLVPQEQVCNGVDGDCDGFADDGFNNKGLPCQDTQLGLCRRTGTYQCNTAGDDTECVLTSPVVTPVPEVCSGSNQFCCDGIDQNCDGTPDNGTSNGEVVHVVSGLSNYTIMRYEASRPNSTSSSPGTLEHKACSLPNRQPWTSADWNEADATCRALGTGWGLCSETQWQLACGGAANQTYPYGASYDEDRCNGEDYDPVCGPPDTDVAKATGSLYNACGTGTLMCQSPVFGSGTTPAIGAVDMSGNVKEWTSTVVSASPLAYRIRGGAYDTIAPGLTCDFDFVAGEPTYYFTNLGFRCCKNGAP